ncbi:hypothetical protein DERP_005865 [Dermatophagoides pteronyssinus]|uniref:Uncharacterized protein n=1 Tax=Dermatophagoides pteronyssinus TaxID=6956 RepID=A0ABQ8JA91_DERPT|nr:hypothetical protein DERP_005865 [Dermatophagoides pteronyssinus]
MTRRFEYTKTIGNIDTAIQTTNCASSGFNRFCSLTSLNAGPAGSKLKINRTFGCRKRLPAKPQICPPKLCPIIV